MEDGKAQPAAAKSGRPGKAAPSGDKTAYPARPAAGPARLRRRHMWLILLFAVWVVAPLTVSAVYLYAVAKPQYASHVGFSVRREDVSSPVELLGGITELSGSSSSDTDILYEFIRSQQMVRQVHERLNLVDIYTLPGDPVFSLQDDHRIEALSSYWQRMVKVFYDNASGLIEIRVLAFEAQDAQEIATAVFEESSAMINKLSAIARSDATTYAREELDRAVQRLKDTRTAMTAFRSRTQIVDPAADIQGRMGLLNTLQQQLAESLIELDLLTDNVSPNDPRVEQAQKRVLVIQQRIDAERDQFGSTKDPQANAYTDLISEYESLAVDLEFAENAYVAALAAYDAALAEAQRKSRYLAMHIEPTLAETARYPQKGVLLGIVAAFLVISWSIVVMIYYSLRDRR